MADFELIVGVEHSTSYAEMKKGIEQLVSELNSQESFKIKVGIDRNSSGEIKSDVKQISDGISNSLSKDLVKGVNKIAGSLENLSKNGAESIANITNRLTEMLDVITKINAKDFNISNVLNLGGNGAGRKELSLYKDEALELVRVINKMEEALRGASGKAFAAIYSNRVASGNYEGFLKEWGSGLTDAQKAINKASTVSSMEGLIGGYSALRDRISEIYTLAKSADPLLPNIDTSALEEATKKVNDLQDAQERIRERIIESTTGASTTTNSAAGDSTEKLKELPEMIKTPLDEIRAQLEKTFDLSTIDMHTDAVKEQLSSLTKEIGKLSNSRGGSGGGSGGREANKEAIKQETEAIKAENKAIKEATEVINTYTRLRKFAISNGAATQGADGTWKATRENYEELANRLNALRTSYDSLTSAETKSTQSARVQEAVIKKVTQAEEELNLAKMKASDTTRQEETEESKRTSLLARATELQRQYTNALNDWTAAKNGKSSGAYNEIKENSAELGTLIERLKNKSIITREAERELDNFRGKLASNSGTIRSAGENVKAFGDRVGGMVEKFSQWFSMTRIIMAVYRSLKQLVSAAMEVDKSMTQLQIVTRETDETMAHFADAAADAAKRVGASITDFVDSATVFARLGYTLDESATLAEYTTMLQNVGDIDVEDAQNAITAIVKAFGVNVDEIESIMDKLVVTGNNFPISVSQIAEGMNNASSALAAAGNTFEESVALLTAANTTVQNASKASTGLRTIAARLRNTKTELDELGETMEEAKYEEVVKQLTDFNVALTDANGEYRSTYDIMKDLAAKWGDLNSMEQAALATNLAGTRQQAIFFSIIEQFKEASGAMDAMADSAGELDRAYSTYLESVEAHVNQFKTVFQDIGQDLFKQDFLTGIIDLGTQALGLVDGILKIVNAVGGLNTVLPVTIALVAALKLNNIIDLVGALGKKLIDSFKDSSIVRGIRAATAGMASLADGTKEAEAEFTALGGTASVVTGAISALTAAVSVGIIVYSALKQSMEEARNAAISSGEATARESKELSELLINYREVKAGIEGGTKSKEDLKTITDALADKLGIEKIKVDELTDSYSKNEDAIQKATRAKRGSMQVNLDTAVNAAADKLKEEATLPGADGFLKDLGLAYINFAKKVSSALGMNGGVDAGVAYVARYEEYIKAETQEALKAVESFIQAQGRFSDFMSSDRGEFGYASFIDYDPDDINSVVDAYDKLEEILSVLSQSGYSNSDVFKQLSERYTALTDAVNTYRDAVKADNEDLAAEYANNELLNKELPRTQEEFDKLRESIIKNMMASKRYSGVVGDVESAVDSVLYMYPELRDFFNTTGEDASNGLHPISSFSSSLTDLKDKLESTKSAYDILHTAESEMIKTGELSQETIKAMAKVTDDYIDYLYVENGVVKLNTEAWREYAESGMGASIEKSEQSLERLREQQALIEENIETLNKAKRVADDYDGEIEEGTWRASEWNKALENQNKLLEENKAAIEDETKRMEIYKSVYDGILESQDTNSLSYLTDFISSMSDSLSTIADLQREVADGFTMSLDKALEFAKVYPEILDSATVSADGQIKLNEDVVNAIISGKQAEVQASIDAQIKDLKAEKSSLEAKKAFAEAQLEIAQSVGTGEGQISRDLAQYRLDLSNELVKALMKNGMTEEEALRAAAEAMGTNFGEFGKYTGEVTEDMAANMADAAKAMADAIYNNALKVVKDMHAIGTAAHETSVQVANINKGTSADYNPSNSRLSGGGVYHNNFVTSRGAGTFTTYDGPGLKTSVGDTLDGLVSQLNLDIEGFAKGIAQIDSKIALLNGLKNMSPQHWSAGKGSGGSGGGSSGGSGSKSSSSSKEDEIDDWFKRQYAEHQHLINMDQESVAEYLAWLNDAYKRAYNEGLIDLDGFYKYQEEIYKGLQDLFKEYLSDTEHEISMRESFDGETKKIISLYEEMMAAIEKEIADARKRGLDDDDDYIQELQKKWVSYGDAIKKAREDLEKNAADATKKLVDIRVQMLKQDIQNEKDALNERRKLLKEFYDRQKEMLQDQQDEEKYYKEQADKRKKITDIQLQLTQLERDDSAAAEKKKLELRQQLVDAQEELNEFERDHALQMAQEQLDNLYEMQDKELEAQETLLEEKEKDTKSLYEQALEDVKNGSIDLYNEMIEWNNKYGDGIEDTITSAWEDAYKALKDYRDLYGTPFEGYDLANATGYKPQNSTWEKQVVSKPTGGSTAGSSVSTGTKASSGASTASAKKSAATSAAASGGAGAGQKSGTSSSGAVSDAVKRKVAAAIWNRATASGWGDNPIRAKRLEEVFGKNNGIQALINQGVGKMDPYPGDEYSYPKMRKKYKGYASGTGSASSGLHRIDELGTETIFQSADGSRYKMFTGGEKVLNAKASDFLYNFANKGSELFGNMFGGLSGGIGGINRSGLATNIVMGDIIIQGNADKSTVSEIRRAQRESVSNLLKELGRLSK